MEALPTRGVPATDEWLRDALRRIAGELVLFSRTFIAFTFRPARAAADWQSGARVFTNPLAFAATAAALYWGVAGLLAAVWPIPEAGPSARVADEISSALGPYLHYGLLGSAMHVTFRALGSHRRILGSIGTAFFAGGSIGTLTALLLSAAARWLGHTRGTAALELRSGDPAPLLLLLAAVAAYALLCLVMARAMMALHRTAAWKAIVAAASAVILTAVLLGSVVPGENYGWHPYIRIDPSGTPAAAAGFRG